MSANAPIPLRGDPASLAYLERRAFDRTLAAAVIARRVRRQPRSLAGSGRRIAGSARCCQPDGDRLDPGSPVEACREPAPDCSGLSGGLLFASSGVLSLDFAGVYSFAIPHVGAHPVPLFTAEGAPIPVAQPAISSTVIGPVRKLCAIASFSKELANAVPEDLAQLLGRLLGESANKAFDAAVFSTTAASSVQPAGLLAGVAPLAPTAIGGTAIDTIGSDLALLGTAFAAANINSQDIALVVHPAQRLKLLTVLGYPQPSIRILSSIGIAAGTVIAVVPAALATGYDGDLEIEAASSPTLHFDASVPAELVTAAGAGFGRV